MALQYSPNIEDSNDTDISVNDTKNYHSDTYSRQRKIDVNSVVIFPNVQIGMFCFEGNV